MAHREIKLNILMRWCVTGAVSILAMLLLCNVQAATVTTQLDRSTIMAGESANLSVVVEGGNPRNIENFPPLDGISIQYRGNTRSMVTVNGQFSSKNILNFSVSASKPGQYTIPATRIFVDGAAINTKPVSLTVTKSEFNADNPINRYAFLRLLSSKQEVFVGEVFPIEVQLYVTAADNPQFPQLKGDGFVVHKQQQQGNSQTQIGNTIFNVLPFAMAVSAAKAGSLTLGPAEMALTLHMRGQADPNDLFGFARVQRRPVQLVSPTNEIKVLPLPRENVPPEFTGAIGSFNWNVTASPDAVKAGDPITLRISVTGSGNLDNLKLPEFNWSEFRLYEPNSSITSEHPLGIQGTKTFEQVIVPLSASVKQIPEFTLAYFDPAQRSYVKLSRPAQPIKVAPGDVTGRQPAVLAKSSEQPDEMEERTDIVHIKTEPGSIIAMTPPLVKQGWFVALQAIPLALFIGLTFWRRREDHLANNPRLRRKTSVRKAVQSGLHDLRQNAGGSDTEAFFAQVFRLMQEQLGQVLDLPASAITEAVLDERLPRRGASAELIERLHELFQVCNQARYAPSRTHQELLAVTAKLESALTELQQLPE